MIKLKQLLNEEFTSIHTYKNLTLKTDVDDLMADDYSFISKELYGFMKKKYNISGTKIEVIIKK